MFIYSFKASSIKFFAVLCVALAALITLIAFVPAYAGGETTPSGGSAGNTLGGAADAPEAESGVTVSYRYDKVKTADDAAAFLGQFGWLVDAGSVETREVTIPAEFDKIFAGYNELQRAQGLDLAKYKKKTVTRHTFTVTNYADRADAACTDTVYANVLVYRGRVIGGDICSANVSGFIHGFECPREE
jgi:hypothetical protein